MIPSSASETASAEMIFGSTARGDTDTLSDRDILIADDDTRLLNRRGSDLRERGWSVAPYTFAKLEALSSRGALFIQHLRKEGKLIVDTHGRLGTLLRHYKPLNDYSHDLADNAHLSRLIAEVTPGRGELFAADLLYVAVRNFGVLWLASRGIHIYAFDKIIEALEEHGALTTSKSTNFQQLRTFKSLYRSGELPNGSHIVSLINSILSLLPKSYFPQECKVVRPQRVINALSSEEGASAYLILRDLEKRLIAMEDIIGQPIENENINKLRSWIINPRAYANLSASMAPTLRSTLKACLGHFAADSNLDQAAPSLPMNVPNQYRLSTNGGCLSI